MQVSTVSSPSSQAVLPDSLTNINRQGNFAEKDAAAATPVAAAASLDVVKDGADAERVTLTPAAATLRPVTDFAPVYAEIWKSGTKVAEIDIHGGVTPVSGLVAAEPGTVAGNGALLAARRAAEIVRSIGGEIRVGGQVMDSQTLDMRARLRQMYGITT